MADYLSLFHFFLTHHNEVLFAYNSATRRVARVSEAYAQLHFDYTPEEQPLYACFDINKLQQVLNNLVFNAIKFTPAGGHIWVRLARSGEYARITVAGTGVGIPAAPPPLLFDKFTKARRPGLRGEKTTGLGMSVIQTIVGLHQGCIWVDSTEGAGTTVYIAVPALPA